MAKEYFWLKLKADFFEDKVIKYLRKLPDGNGIVIVYLKMQLKSLKTEGFLKYDGILPAYEEELALLLDEDANLVKFTIQALLNLGVVERWENDTLYMASMQELIGKETAVAERVRRHRARKKLLEEQETLHCNSDETKMLHCNTEKRREEKRREDKIRDREEIEGVVTDVPTKPKKTRHKHGEYQNVLLTDEDMQKLQTEFPSDWQERIERLSEYMASKGASYKNHLATIRAWARKEAKQPQVMAQGNTGRSIPQIDMAERAIAMLRQQEG